MLRDLITPDLVTSALRTLGGPQGALVAEVINRARQAQGQVGADPARNEAAKRKFVRWLHDLSGGIILILGRRGSGKTSACCYVAEFRKRPVKVVGIPQDLLPATWEELQPEDLDKSLYGVDVILDDASQLYSAYDHMTDVSRKLHDLVDLTRHREVTLIVNSQRSQAADRYLIGEPNCLLLKPPSLLFMDSERDEVRRKMVNVELAFRAIPEEDWVRYVYVYADCFQGMMEIPTASFWNSRLSRNKARVMYEPI